MGREGQNACAALTAAVCFVAVIASPALAQTRWSQGPYLCPTPALVLDTGRQTTCDHPVTTVRVIITGVTAKDDIGRVFTQVRLEDGRIVYLNEIDMGRLLTEDPAVVAAREKKAEAAEAEKRKKQEQAAAIARGKEIEARRVECERRGQPKVGMTPAQAAETCWRQPRRIVKKTTNTGVSEDYIYSIGHILRFQDGILSEVIETR